MGNLAAPHTREEWNRIYLTALDKAYYENISRIQTNYNELYLMRSAYYNNPTDENNKLRKELCDLRDILYKEESKLFTAIGYSSDPQEALNQMNNQLDELNKNLGFRMLCNGTPEFAAFVNSLTGEGIDYTQEVEAIFDTADMRNAFARYLNFENRANESDENTVGVQIRDAINTAILNLNTKDSRGNVKGGFGKSIRMPIWARVDGQIQQVGWKPATGIDYTIQEIKFDLTEGEEGPEASHVYFKFDAAPNRDIIKKMREAGISFSKKTTNNDQSDTNILLKLDRLLQKPLGKYYKYAQPYLTGTKAKQIVFAGTKSNIAGGLGELRAMIFLSCLANNREGNIATAAGKITADREILGEIQASKEIPIDAFLNTVGFQIKNYNIAPTGQTYAPSQVMPLPQFVSHLTTDDLVRQIILEFFAAESYNYYLLSDQSEVAGLSNEQTYRKLYDNFSFEREKKFKTIADSYIHNLLQIESNFALVDKTLPAELRGSGAVETRYNTFFMISRFLVPASKIIEAIIDELDKNGFSFDNNQSIVRSSYSVMNPRQRESYYRSEAKKATEVPIKTKYLEKAEAAKAQISEWSRNYVQVPVVDIAQKINVNYRLSLSLDSILKRAVQVAARNGTPMK